MVKILNIPSRAGNGDVDENDLNNALKANGILSTQIISISHREQSIVVYYDDLIKQPYPPQLDAKVPIAQPPAPAPAQPQGLAPQPKRIADSIRYTL